MRIGERMVTHPESQPVVNSELSSLSPYMAPPSQGTDQPPMRNGGEVERDDSDNADIADLITRITQSMQSPQLYRYGHLH